MGRKEMYGGFWWGNLKENVVVDGNVILKQILQPHEAQDRNQWRTVVHTAVQTLYCFHRAFSLSEV